MGLTLQGFRDKLAIDLKITIGTEMSIVELNRAVEKTVDDLSRYLPLEKVHEETLDFDVSDESFTTPAAADPDAIVDAQSLSGKVSGGTLTIADATPDVPRRLTVTRNEVFEGAASIELTITIKGTDPDGNYIEERWYLKDLVSLIALQGELYFKYVTTVEVTNAGGSSDDTIDVGTGNAYDSYIFLANKPLRPNSGETVTSDPAGTTYTRDTDYTIDWTNGSIRFINDGSMVAGTAYLIDYTKSRLGISISSLLPVVTKISKVQYPVNQIPQQFVSFNIVGDFMFVASMVAGQSQQELADKAHIAIWYERRQMPPSEHSPGSYPDVLDEVIAIGGAGYALLTEAQQYEQAAATAITTMNTALTNAIKYLNNNSDADMAGILQDITDDAAKLRTAIATALDAANAYLDEVDITDLGKANVGAEAYTETGDDKIDLVNVGDRVGEKYADYARTRAEIGNTRISASIGYIQEATARLTNLQTYIRQSEGYNGLAQGFLQEAQMRAETV
ncbi:hypothetical protein LCGC14_2030110, partial [marine sediment metagenome]